MIWLGVYFGGEKEPFWGEMAMHGKSLRGYEESFALLKDTSPFMVLSMLLIDVEGVVMLLDFVFEEGFSLETPVAMLIVMAFILGSILTLYTLFTKLIPAVRGLVGMNL